ncbi:putative proton-coupled thiamine transporter YuaJ [Niallia circulans]|jgi:thiamine transporter|uniref:Proton-coupled thiamine transporter YuaJ n=1 Tax=Niallia circulans TaxID=1397 RepID=A0A0J1IQ47_NIACI|nr:energy-coupled thiamine transporter ThiT [Niallia circulans]KLV28084.1 proton-coupled thiamine transporter YuaJ [Niallia circulans]MDR4314911.1 energy-coupled thiamine transporter ThiT [Niallia circulans]MED3837774.1 energy-coupled thiamine transporter ThiT [Niallia circulans]MED4243079.1 energy-coupled thiamine transporter ThiT [Niallia circulans]MED4247058.1 energy-coupled thiamine transporter ThiT [Niallia circulans]
MKNMKLVVMIEVAIMAAIALILDLLPSIPIFNTSISFAMVPIFIVAFRWGFKASASAGFLWGLLQIVFDLQALTFWQVILEYLVAFACIGFAGLFASSIQNALKTEQKGLATGLIILAVVVGGFTRYIWHFIAGVTVWAKFAPEGMSPFINSLIVNGGSYLGATILCSIILVLLVVSAPRIVLDRPVNGVSKN